jgi:hypothetical protein
VNHGTIFFKNNVPWCIHEFGIYRHKTMKKDKRTYLRTFNMKEYARKVTERHNTLPTMWVWYVTQRKRYSHIILERKPEWNRPFRRPSHKLRLHKNKYKI